MTMNTEFVRPQSTALLTAGTGWEADLVANPGVVQDTIAGGWLMSYSGFSNSTVKWSTGYATAPNLTSGGTWTKGSNNPIETPQVASSFIAGNGNICIKGSTYYNFFVEASSDFVTVPGKMYLSTASSLSGTWTRQNSGNAVMSPGSAGSLDAVGIADPFVTLMADGVTFECIYQGQKTGGDLRQYLRATSTDGITWTKQGLFALGGPNLNSAQGEPVIIRDPNNTSLVSMFHDEAVSNGNSRTIGRAYSKDNGANWSWRVQALGPTVSGWESSEVFDNSAVLYQGKIYLFHAGTDNNGNGTGGQGVDFQIGYAVADYYPGVF